MMRKSPPSNDAFPLMDHQSYKKMRSETTNVVEMKHHHHVSPELTRYNDNTIPSLLHITHHQHLAYDSNIMRPNGIPAHLNKSTLNMPILL